jgi:hypothetical protein
MHRRVHVCARIIGVQSHVLFECLVNAQSATVPPLPYSLAASSEGGVHVHK